MRPCTPVKERQETSSGSDARKRGRTKDNREDDFEKRLKHDDGDNCVITDDFNYNNIDIITIHWYRKKKSRR